MKSQARSMVLTTTIAALVVTAAVVLQDRRMSRGTTGTTAWTQARRQALTHVAGWPENSRGLAAVMLERYGPPDRLPRHALVWKERAPWKRIVVHKEPADSPLEQTVDYYVFPRRLSAVRALDHGVIADPRHSELSVRSGNESLNFLGLNLAEEIAMDRRTPADAEELYNKTVALSAAGKSSPYLEGLRFKPHRFSDRDWGKPPQLP